MSRLQHHPASVPFGELVVCVGVSRPRPGGHICDGSAACIAASIAPRRERVDFDGLLFVLASGQGSVDAEKDTSVAKLEACICASVYLSTSTNLCGANPPWLPGYDRLGDFCFRATYPNSELPFKVIRGLGACSRLARLDFFLTADSDFALTLHGLMPELSFRLRSNRCLSTFNFCTRAGTLTCWTKYLPDLLVENKSLKSLTIDLIADQDFNWEAAEDIAICLERNTVLETLGFKTVIGELQDEIGLSRVVETLLRPLCHTPEARRINYSLKELVLGLVPASEVVEVVANVLRCNLSLQKLSLVHPFTLGERSAEVMSQALRINKGLEELSILCDGHEAVRKIVRSLYFNLFNQTNTSLQSLEISYDFKKCERLSQAGPQALQEHHRNCVKEVVNMLGSNKTLRHVKLGMSPRYKVSMASTEVGNFLNKLKWNKTLESFSFGDWKVLRIGKELHTTFQDQLRCSEMTAKEYKVIVKIA